MKDGGNERKKVCHVVLGDQNTGPLKNATFEYSLEIMEGRRLMYTSLNRFLVRGEST